MVMKNDMNKALRNALSTGKVLIGSKQTAEAVKNGEARIVVVSSNCPEETLNSIRDVPVIKFRGSSIELGVACGKPFSISTLTVIEPGESEILSLGSMNE